jgi:hypothetical protein
MIDPTNAEERPPATTTTTRTPVRPTTSLLLTDFEEIYDQEFCEIRPFEGPNDARTRKPSTADGMTGIALSGGGVRSASFCLGVLQALHAAGIFDRLHYLSTVSGGGYIGTSVTVARSKPGSGFPFPLRGPDGRETLETGHLRDNSRYLLQNGARSAVSAGAIYLRGIVMNVVVVWPFLLAAAALLAFLKPDTQRLTGVPELIGFLPDAIKQSGWPFTLFALGMLVVLLAAYAVGVSIFPILKLKARRRMAIVAAVLLAVCALPVLLEAHFALLRVMFGVALQTGGSLPPPSASPAPLRPGPAFEDVTRLVVWLAPIVLAVLPFVKSIAEKAVSSAKAGVSEFLATWTSRIVLFVVATIVPLMLWLVVLQLAYWAIGVSVCPTGGVSCGAAVADEWKHAPSFLRDAFGYATAVPSREVWGWPAVVYFLTALAWTVLSWPILNVNSNSLHQLYRDRLGSAFLFKRSDEPDAAGNPKLDGADDVKFSAIPSGNLPYHIINAALNVPGSPFANRRGRNADFFVFSKLFTGSEATGYVSTRTAEEVTDGLNIGTAMAISGAAAAPNMGMASMRPLSPTIAFLNVRLGRWLRHPVDIVKLEGANKAKLWWLGKPGPMYLLREAFFKSGATITDERIAKGGSAGFVFLTDGGHIENLGIYELLRRRCSIIIAVDGEADPDMTSSSLVQLQRFARIDFGAIITMDWQSIGERSREVSNKVAKKERSVAAGPHVALGLIEYPALPGTTDIQKGVLVYVKSSLSGDENDYVMAYKAENPTFPHETTMDQLFTEEQFECYRALGEHIARHAITGADNVSVEASRKDELLAMARILFPNMRA